MLPRLAERSDQRAEDLASRYVLFSRFGDLLLERAGYSCIRCELLALQKGPVHVLREVCDGCARRVEPHLEELGQRLALSKRGGCRVALALD